MSSQKKTITQVIESPRPHWVGDGFFVRPLFADFAFQREISPFLMLDYAAPAQFPPSDTPPGVGPHPHKGFETVTIVYDGEVEHRDSTGAIGCIGPGEVQWMTAGSGIVHEEFHSRAAAKRGGVVSMSQLWVNLPMRDKSAAPHYQDIRKDSIPEVSTGGGMVRVVEDETGRLRVAAATTVGDKGFERTEALVDAEVDVIIIDTAHGHSRMVAAAVERVRKLSGKVQIVAGNVATGEATKALIGAGTIPKSSGLI